MSKSQWSNEVWEHTVTNGGAPPIFADNFDNYAVGTRLSSSNSDPEISVNGARWWFASGDGADSEPRIVSGGYGGDANALGFRFQNHLENKGRTEQRYYLCDSPTTTVKELWAEYFVYWPINYEKHDLDGSPNDKTFDLMSSEYGKIVSTHYAGDYWSDHEQWAPSTTTRSFISQNVSMGRDGARRNWGHATDDYATPPYSGSNFQGSNEYSPFYDDPDPAKAFWDKTADNGNWRRYRFHVRPATAAGTYDALFHCWKGDALIAEIKGSDFADDTVTGWDSGYLFGAHNAGVREACVVKVSRFKVYSADPAWS